MIGRVRDYLKKLPWLPFALAGLGFLLYLGQSWRLSQTLGISSLDESMYVYKGYLFASGKYLPYQDFGPSTNHMPLAFMIPGIIQLWFGPGMGTARAFAFVVGALMLVGVWLAVWRLGGGLKDRWWAAGIVWLFALNPSWQEIFSQGLSQGIVNVFLAWAFVFLLGQERKAWQLSLAAGLAALAVMTRINTAPVLGLMLIFIFWQHGWKKGLWAAAAAAAVGGAVMALFWPGVLKFVSGWIPDALTASGPLSFIEAYRSPWSQQHVPDGFSYFPLTAWFGNPKALQWKGVAALYESFHGNLVPYLAALGALVFWPKQTDWPDQYHFRLSLFLLVGWWLMAAMHMWVALSGSSCPFYCLSGYFSFFNLFALLLIPASLPYWRVRQVAVWRQLVGLAALFGIVGGALSAAGFIIKRVRNYWIALLDVEIPRLKGGRIVWGDSGPLRSIFEAKLGLDYNTLIDVFPPYFYWALLVLLVFGVTALLYRIFKRWVGPKAGYAVFALLVFMAAAVVFSPTKVFYNDTPFVKCADGSVASHEAVGAELAAVLPDGATVYWDLSSNMLLLYLPQVEIFPPQLNTKFNFVKDSLPGEQDEIYRFGYWDQSLKEDWLAEAEYLLVAGYQYDNWADLLSSGLYERVETTTPYNICREKKTMVYVFHRIDD